MKILEFALLSLMPEEIIVVSPISFQILLTVWSQFSLDYVLPVAFIIVYLTPYFSLSLVCLCMLFFGSLPFCCCVCLCVLFVFVCFPSIETYLLGKWAKLKTDLSEFPKSIFFFLLKNSPCLFP